MRGHIFWGKRQHNSQVDPCISPSCFCSGIYPRKKEFCYWARKGHTSGFIVSLMLLGLFTIRTIDSWKRQRHSVRKEKIRKPLFTRFTDFLADDQPWAAAAFTSLRSQQLLHLIQNLYYSPGRIFTSSSLHGISRLLSEKISSPHLYIAAESRLHVNTCCWIDMQAVPWRTGNWKGKFSILLHKPRFPETSCRKNYYESGMIDCISVIWPRPWLWLPVIYLLSVNSQSF